MTSSKSPLKEKEPTSSKRQRQSKSPCRSHSRGSRSRSRSPSKKKSSRSRTPSKKRRSRSRSPSKKKSSRSRTPSKKRRTRSRSPSKKKSSRSRTPSKKRRSRSRSPSKNKRSRSRSLSKKKRSRSRTSSKKKRSKCRSPSKKKKSRSRSLSKKRSRSRTSSKKKRSKCRSPSKKRRSRSPSRKKRSRSRTPSKKKRSRSRSKTPSKKKRSRSRSPLKKKRSRSRSKTHSKKKRSRSRSPLKKKRSRSRSKTPSKKKKSRSRSPWKKKRSRSKTPSKKKRSRSRSGGRRSRRSRSRSVSHGRRRATFSQRDRWKREPSHSPVLILRKNRSPARKLCSLSDSPQRISELDKNQLLEIAKANAAAMCAKAGLPIPPSLRTSVLPMAMLPSMAMNAAMASMTAATMTAALSNMGMSSLLPLPSITNKPPSVSSQPNTALEEVKRKVAKQANSISIKEFTDKCKMIVDSKGELPVAMPHVSDEEDDGKPFGGSALREQKAISFSINNATVRPGVRSDAGMAKEFPVSSGCQHRKKEGETLAKATSSSGEAMPAVVEQPDVEPDNDRVFPEPLLQPVDISQAVTERIKAQRRLAENPYDVNAICMLSRAQEQVDAWAQSSTVPGLFTGSTGAQVLSSEELSTGGPQAWLKKDQFLRAAPVSGGVGEFLMRKMGWKKGEGLGRNREGTVEPIVIDFKIDRKGLVAEGEKPQKQTGGLVVTKDQMGKHPVSALIELCNKRHIVQPDFVMVHHSGPDHRKNFLFKVTVDGVDHQPHTASPNKKLAKAMAATVALQALGEVPADGPGLYTGPVFTAASTGPLIST
ncbi:protein SON [Pseudoliparis swirei]|uniref:protein SON n=1 Tax=Pseudoliparis swirei TaxID=2059687 RepID=UPI0024BE1B1E|nr:protein SON [Pseudoliparis swirei]